MASVTMAGPALRPSLRIQHRQAARPSVACRAVVRPVAQQTQQKEQQRKVGTVSKQSRQISPEHVKDVFRGHWCTI